MLTLQRIVALDLSNLQLHTLSDFCRIIRQAGCEELDIFLNGSQVLEALIEFLQKRCDHQHIFHLGILESSLKFQTVWGSELH